jgi:hypothetical protein
MKGRTRQRLDARHPEARGTTFGAIRTAEARANAPRTAQDGRRNGPSGLDS